MASAPESAGYWRALAGYRGAAFEHRYPDTNDEDGSVASRRVWSAPGRPETGLITIHGGGHTIPNPRYRMARLLGATNRDFSAVAESWRFFSRQLPPEAVVR